MNEPFKNNSRHAVNVVLAIKTSGQTYCTYRGLSLLLGVTWDGAYRAATKAVSEGLIESVKVRTSGGVNLTALKLSPLALRKLGEAGIYG